MTNQQEPQCGEDSTHNNNPTPQIIIVRLEIKATICAQKVSTILHYH